MFPLLETFDPIARPIALRYDGFSRVQPDELPPLFAMSAVPGQRTSRQPLRVVLNARFRLPAGRYVLDLKGSEAAASMPDASMSLQLGREGRPIESWPLVLAPGQHSLRDFDVPLDAEFVGFRASRQAEQAIAELRVSPRSVVERANECRREPFSRRRRLRPSASSFTTALRIPRRKASGWEAAPRCG